MNVKIKATIILFLGIIVISLIIYGFVKIPYIMVIGVMAIFIFLILVGAWFAIVEYLDGY
jgi:hypothetical protein